MSEPSQSNWSWLKFVHDPFKKDAEKIFTDINNGKIISDEPKWSSLFHMNLMPGYIINDNRGIRSLILDNTFTNMIKKAKVYIEEIFPNSVGNWVMMDIHSYHNNEGKEYIGWHKDNDNFKWEHSICKNVLSLIYYYKKDSTIIDGNFELKENEKIYKIEIESEMAIVLDGNITHRPTLVKGKGYRQSLVFQFEKITQ